MVIASSPQITVSAAPLLTATPTLPPNSGGLVGVAWSDADASGTLDEGEVPLAGMSITLKDLGGVLLAVVTTAADGRYQFPSQAPGVYRVSASAPLGYVMTTPDEVDVFISAGSYLVLDFGARFVPTPTPTATTVPRLDIDSAPFVTCGSTWQGDTATGRSNVDRYACAPGWDESGPELVYRLELGRGQLVTAVLVSAAADLDLFLLPSAYPETCLAAGDNYLSHTVQPGIYFLAVDGFQGASGAFSMRLECPLGPQATATFTPTPSSTPTVTPTRTQGPTPTPTATVAPKKYYLPMILRLHPMESPPPAVLVLQQGVADFAGVTDTTLSAWEPNTAFGQDALLRLRYNGQTPITTHMAPLIRFDLAMLPVSANVVSATLGLYLAAPPEADLRAEIHSLLREWDEASASWQQRASGQLWTVQGAQGVGADHDGAIVDTRTVDPSGQWVVFDVKELAQFWIRRPESNYGAMLMARPGLSNANVEAGFASSNHPTVGRRPILTVGYWLPAKQ